MPSRYYRLAAPLVLVASGCSTTLPPSAQPPSSGLPTNAASSSAKQSGPFLYVNGYYISQYRLGSSTPIHSISAPLGLSRTIGLDANHNLFSQNVNVSWGTMTVYDARNLALERTYQGTENISSFAFDQRSYVYAGGCSRIGIFKPGGGNGLYRVVGHGANSVCSLVADGAGNLYAGNAYGHSVSLYKPGARGGHPQLVRRIVRGIHNPFFLLLDRSGRLYVADCVSCYYSTPPRRDTISIYSPGKTAPDLVIKDGIDHPLSLAVDSTGTLYVGNAPFENGTFGPGWISVYSTGARKPRRQITDGINYPVSLAVDPSDRLYVANTDGGTVTVYERNATKPATTITDGVGYPFQVLIGTP